MKRPAGAKKPAGGTQGSTTPPGAQADMAKTRMELAAVAPPSMTPTAGGNPDPSGTTPWIERKVYNLTGKNFKCKSVQVDYGVPGGVVRVEWMCW